MLQKRQGRAGWHLWLVLKHLCQVIKVLGLVNRYVLLTSLTNYLNKTFHLRLNAAVHIGHIFQITIHEICLKKEPTFTSAQSLNKKVETTVTYVEESFSLG